MFGLKMWVHIIQRCTLYVAKYRVYFHIFKSLSFLHSLLITGCKQLCTSIRLNGCHYIFICWDIISVVSVTIKFRTLCNIKLHINHHITNYPLTLWHIVTSFTISISMQLDLLTLLTHQAATHVPAKPAVFSYGSKQYSVQNVQNSPRAPCCEACGHLLRGLTT